MNSLSDFRKLVCQIETRLERPVTVHISNGLVGYRCYAQGNPLGAEILLSLDDNATYDDMAATLLRCVVRLEGVAAEYQEPSSVPVDSELARQAAELREEFVD